MTRQVSDAPIYICHNPRPTGGEEIPSEQVDYPAIHAFLSRELDVAGTHLIAQPAETLINGWNTKPELAKGSTRLDIGDNFSNEPHPVEDVSHINMGFGGVYLEHLFPEVASS